MLKLMVSITPSFQPYTLKSTGSQMRAKKTINSTIVFIFNQPITLEIHFATFPTTPVEPAMAPYTAPKPTEFHFASPLIINEPFATEITAQVVPTVSASQTNLR